MNPAQLKGLGFLLGIIGVALAVIHLMATYKEGNANWYLLVMICGMLLILYYTISSAGRRR